MAYIPIDRIDLMPSKYWERINELAEIVGINEKGSGWCLAFISCLW
jgi:hypothetical protein